MNHAISPEQVYGWELALDGWVFWATSAFFFVELVRLAVRRMLGWNVIADALTNFLTFAAYITISFVALTALYQGVYYTVHEYFSLTQIPVTPWSIAPCVVLAVLALLLRAPLLPPGRHCLGDPHRSPQLAVLQHFRGLSFRATGRVLPHLLPYPAGVRRVRPDRGLLQ